MVEVELVDEVGNVVEVVEGLGAGSLWASTQYDFPASTAHVTGREGFCETARSVRFLQVTSQIGAMDTLTQRTKSARVMKLSLMIASQVVAELTSAHQVQ